MPSLPEWEARWLALCAQHDLLDAESTWLRIQSAYTESHRAYHNFDHIEHCLKLLDEYAEFAANEHALEFAIWYHDIVYDTHATDNEEKSAQLAAVFLRGSPLRDAVMDLILATRHMGEFLPNDLGIIADIDLAILGEPEQAYDAYAAQIRQEYAWVEPQTYVKKRTHVLQQFLEQGIYSTIIFEEDHETRARSNLQREIDQLSQWLKRMR